MEKKEPVVVTKRLLIERGFEPTEGFLELSASSVVNQIRVVIAIFKCKCCSMRKEACLWFKNDDCFYT